VDYSEVYRQARAIVEDEPVNLTETLAERIAAVVLTYPRVVSAKVRVEKLEVGPGAVGVEILRERAADVAKVHQLYPAAVDSKAADSKAADPKAAE
jgi:dihydroneopterin aldolase